MTESKLESLFRFIYWMLKPIEKIMKPTLSNSLILKNFNDKKMFLNPTLGQGEKIYYDDIAERHVIRVLKSLMKPNMVYFDIGAKWGFHSIIFSNNIGKDGKIVAFEPNPHSYEILKKN